MADATSTVELIFQGVDKTAEATQAALKNAQSFSTSVQNVTGPMADATIAAVKFEAALLGAGAAVTTFAVVAAGEFDSAFREISTLIDAPVEDLDRFRRAILDYATDSTASLEQITQSVYNAISAGVDYTDSLETLRQAEQLSVAGRADLDSSLTLLVSTLNAYGAEAEDAAWFSDLLFTTVRQGQTTLPELANSLASVTGLAATAGVGFDELLAAIATLTATGTPTSQAITQIQGAIAAILKPTSQAQALAEELGIKFDVQRLAAVGLEGILQDVAQATGGNSEQMARLFGRVEALNGVLTLTGLGAETFADNLLEMDSAAGATGDAYEKMAGDIEQSNQRLGNALRGLLIEIGTPLLEEYGSVTSAIAAIFNALGDNVQSGQLGDLVEFIRAILSDTAGLFDEFARNLPGALAQADLSGFQRNIEAVLEGVQKLFSGVDISTEQGLADLITNVGAGFARLGEFVGAAIGALGPMLDALLTIAETIVGLDDKWFKIGGTIGGVAIVIDKVLGPALDLLLAIFLVKQGGGLVKGLASAAAGFGGLATAVGTLSGYLAVGASLWKIGELAGILVDWAGAANQAADAQDRANRTIALSEGELRRVADELGIVVEGYDDFWQLVKDGVVVADQASGRWVLATQAQGDAIKGVERDYEAYVNTVASESDLAREINDKLSESFAESGRVFNAVTGEVERAGGAISGVTGSLEEADEFTGRWIKTLIDGVPTFTQAGANATVAFDGAAESAKDAFEQTDAYFLKLLQLASDERIAQIEGNVTLNVEQLEADTARIQAAFESVTATVENTGTVMTELFGLLVDFDGSLLSTQGQLLTNAIQDEQRSRDEALRLQEELTRAQIDEIKARTESLERGDAMITVDGAGLQPHLEAFMWEILRAVQVRVNEDGLEMLLGAG